MKFNYFLALIFMVFSCSVENNDTQFYEKELTSTRTDTPPIELEYKMQWTSFIAAIVLEEEPLARAEFMSLVSLAMNETISLKNILSSNSIAPNFKATFLDKLEWYSMIICQTGKPEPGVVIQNTAIDPTCFEELLQYIYNENCLEFYFPKGLALNPILPITSTAHPLNQANFNYGYKRHQKVSGNTKVSIEKVNASYVDNNKDIIVTRPVNEGECDYSDYGVPDFTTFLNN